jgi:hypothetical protein
VQLIQRTSCPDRQQSPAAYLAAMIDERARNAGRSAERSGVISGDLGTLVQRPDASVLIWVEDNAELVREPAAERLRGMILVAHVAGQGCKNGSFIISYPVDANEDRERVDAVSSVLEGMGWSVVGSLCEGTAQGHVNTAVLVSNAHLGSEQRLWLAEPVGESPHSVARANAPASRSSGASADVGARTREIRDKLETLATESAEGNDALL